MRNLIVAGCVLCCAIVWASPASGLSLLLEGPTTGTLATGLGVEQATVGDSLSFEITLDAAVGLNGYDLLITWDPAELALIGAADLSGHGFGPDPLASAGMPRRAAAIGLVPITTADLMQLQFSVVSVLEDGLVDLMVTANGNGLSPGGLVLTSATSAGIAIPEPRLAFLLVLALLAVRSNIRSPHDLAS